MATVAWVPRQTSEAAAVRDDDDAGVAVGSSTPVTAGAGGTGAAGSAGAGGVDASMHSPDMAGSGGQPAAGAAAPPANQNPCSRDILQQRLQAYLDAMALGDPKALRAHPNVYYTENGQKQTLGAGLWLSRPKATFTRSALDSQECGSITEAVLSDSLGQKIIFAVRLRYQDELLTEVEAMVVRPAPNLFAPDAIAVPAPDPWLTPISGERDALLAVAQNFFEAIVRPDVTPPHAMTCMLRQNGVEVGGGNCSPGSAAERFEELRYPVIDETTGLVGAIGLGHDFLVMFLIKIEDGTLINIDSVGGHSSNKSGW